MSLFKPKVDRDEVNPEKPQSPAMAVLDAAQPLNVEGGEGKIHEMVDRHASLAIKQAMVVAQRHALAAADPRPLVRKYPAATIGGAAAVGLIGALLAVPSEKQRAANRLHAIERALRDEAAYDGPKAAASTPSIGKRLFQIGMRYAKPTLISMATSALTGAISGGSTAAATSGK